MRVREILEQLRRRFGFPVVVPSTPFVREGEEEVFCAADCAKIQRDVRQLAGEAGGCAIIAGSFLAVQARAKRCRWRS